MITKLKSNHMFFYAGADFMISSKDVSLGTEHFTSVLTEMSD